MAVWSEIRCDVNGPACFDHLNLGPMGFEKPAELRKRGFRDGWIRRDGKDICTRCANRYYLQQARAASSA